MAYSQTGWAQNFSGFDKPVSSAYQKYLDSLPSGTPTWAGRTQNEILTANERSNYAEDMGYTKGKPKTPAKPKQGPGGGGAGSGPTANDRQAAANLTDIAGFNAQSTKNQLKQQQDNLRMSDDQNRALMGVQKDQSSKAVAGDRFAQQRKLQSATSSVLNAAGNALQGSAAGSLAGMLGTRNDLDNNASWGQLTKDHNAADNKYTEAYNSNQLARNEIASNAEFQLRGFEADTAAQRNNINASLYVKPGAPAQKKGGKTVKASGSLGAKGTYEGNKFSPNLAKTTKSLIPDDAAALASLLQPANQLGGTDYFSQLLNGYTNRSY